MTDAATKPAHPDLHPVQSSNVAGIAHDGDALFVKFNNGAVWRYSGVPAAHFEEMKSPACESVGRFFNAHIKSRSEYPGTKVA